MRLDKFVKDNLISGYRNDSFTKEMVNIWTVNYLNKGILSQTDFEEIQQELNPIEEAELTQ